MDSAGARTFKDRKAYEAFLELRADWIDEPEPSTQEKDLMEVAPSSSTPRKVFKAKRKIKSEPAVPHRFKESDE